MNQYSIMMKINGRDLDLCNYLHFIDLFEVFLAHIEEANRHKHYIDDVMLICNDIAVATDVQSIIRIGTFISGFDIMITDALTGNCVMKYPCNLILENVENLRYSKDVKVNIVGRRLEIYSVLQSPVIAQNLKTYFSVWVRDVEFAQKIINDKRKNLLSTKEVDMNWTMEYYIPTEVKKALSFIDTNPEESKKILMVMDYMLSSKVKL